MTPVLYRILTHPAPERAIHDLSLGGVRIYSDEPLDTGQTLELEFVCPDGRTLQAAARVAWSRKLPPGAAGVYDVGMEFVDLPEADRKTLESVLEKA